MQQKAFFPPPECQLGDFKLHIPKALIIIINETASSLTNLQKPLGYPAKVLLENQIALVYRLATRRCITSTPKHK